MTLLNGATLLNPLADIASPVFTGVPAVPTAASGTNTTQASSTAFVQTASLVTGGTTTLAASQTTGFTAAAGGFYPCSASGAGFTATLPTTPTNGSRITLMKTDTTTNAVTVTAGGSDVINASGTTSVKLVNYLAVADLQYISGIWYNRTASGPAHFTLMAHSGTRATGYGDLAEGIYLPQAMELFAINCRIGTVDGGGTNSGGIYTNTTGASTGSALSGASVSTVAWTSTRVTLVTGPWLIAAATYVAWNFTAVGTTPGNRFYIDFIGAWL